MHVNDIWHARVAAIVDQQESGKPAGWLDRPCLGSPFELWFGPADGVESAAERRAREDMAKALCGECPFTAYCLASELALPVRHQHGVRGGLTAAERKAEIRRRRELAGSGVAA